LLGCLPSHIDLPGDFSCTEPGLLVTRRLRRRLEQRLGIAKQLLGLLVGSRLKLVFGARLGDNSTFVRGSGGVRRASRLRSLARHEYLLAGLTSLLDEPFRARQSRRLRIGAAGLFGQTLRLSIVRALPGSLGLRSSLVGLGPGGLRPGA
jgi:hypothetical protein